MSWVRTDVSLCALSERDMVLNLSLIPLNLEIVDLKVE